MRDLIRENKNKIIVGLVLWILISIVLVLPYTVANNAATKRVQNGESYYTVLFEVFQKAVVAPSKSINYIFSNSLVEKYFSNLFVITIIFIILYIILLVKNKPKHNYVGSEHGSSDWSEHGEQYKILNRNSGIILAEGNYLPVDKRGNVNVLVVGRFRFW